MYINGYICHTLSAVGCRICRSTKTINVDVLKAHRACHMCARAAQSFCQLSLPCICMTCGRQAVERKGGGGVFGGVYVCVVHVCVCLLFLTHIFVISRSRRRTDPVSNSIVEPQFPPFPFPASTHCCPLPLVLPSVSIFVCVSGLSVLGIKLTALMLSMFDGCCCCCCWSRWFLLLRPLLPADTCSLCKIFALPDKRQGIVVTLHSSLPPAPSGQLHCLHFMADNLMPGKAEKQESDVAQLKACAKRQWQRFSLRHANLIGLRTYIHIHTEHTQAYTDISLFVYLRC